MDTSPSAAQDRASARNRQVLAAACAVYVLAWIVGLAIAPSAPKPSASDAKVQAFFVHHHWVTTAQALLVHGVAGVALAVLVVSLARWLDGGGTDPTRRLFVYAGLAAASLSLIQVGMEIGINRNVAGSGGAETTAALFHAVNIADLVKLVLLGIAIAAATTLGLRMRVFGSRMRWLGYALPPFLVIGGLAFVIDSGALEGVLDVSLILLLVWAASIGVIAMRGRTSATKVQSTAGS
jgi:hypothetical protein